MIIAYIGNLGTGKTLNAVNDLMENMKRGRTVLSNTPIHFTYKDKTYSSITITDLDDFNKAFINGQNVDIFMDELSVYLPSQYWNHVKPEFIMKFAQMRKFRCNLYYTEQGWTHGIKRIRDLTNWVWVCYKHKTSMPIPSIHIYRDRATKKITNLSLSRYWLYKSIRYSPEYFSHQIIDSKNRIRFQIEKRTLYPATYKRIFPAYNTFFKVRGSNLGKMSLVDKTFNLRDFDKSQNKELLKEDTEAGAFEESSLRPRETGLEIVSGNNPDNSAEFDNFIDNKFG
jgi:hypothetical protein